MEFLYIVILSSVSVSVLFILTKLIGYRQISELNFFDYVIGITIGSISAEMSTNIDLEWWKGVTAMVIYASVGIVFSMLSQRSIKARKFISGQPIILVQNGRIIKKNLKKARIDIDDLLTSARTNGYFNISDIDTAVMENTGKISFLPVPLKRALNPKDFNFAPVREGLCINVVLDGKIIENDLKNANITKKELEREIKAQNKRLENLLLVTVDTNKKITLFEK